MADKVLIFTIWYYPFLKKTCAVGSKLLKANSIFPLGSGTLNTWAMLPANANNGQSSSDGTLKVFPTTAAWKKTTEPPSLIQSEKISGKMFRQVPRDFQLRMCGSSLCLDRQRCRPLKGVWVRQGNICEAGTPEGKQ